MSVSIERSALSPQTYASPTRGKASEVTGKITSIARDTMVLHTSNANSVGRASPLRKEVTPKVTDAGRGLFQSPISSTSACAVSPGFCQPSVSVISTPARLLPEQETVLDTARQNIRAGAQALSQRNLDLALLKLAEGISAYIQIIPVHKELADAFLYVGGAYEQKNELALASGNYKKASEIYKQLSVDPMILTKIYKKMGLVSEGQGNSAEAFVHYKEIARIYETQKELTSPTADLLLDLAGVYDKMALLLEDQHSVAAALEYHVKRAEILEVHSKNSLALANCYDQIGVIRKDSSFYQKSLAIEEGLHKEVRADYFGRIRLSYEAREKIKDINAIYVKANKAGKSTDVFSLGTSYLYMSRVNEASGQLKVGIEKYEDILLSKLVINPKSQYVASALENIGDAYIAQKKTDKAIPMYVRSLEILSKTLPEADPALVALKQKAKGIVTVALEASVARAAASVSQARDGSTVRGPSVIPSDDMGRLITGLGGYSSGRFMKNEIKDAAAQKLARLVIQHRDAAQDKKETTYQDVSKYVNEEVDKKNNPIFDGAHSSNLFALFRDCCRLFPRC